ncbi:ABC transporter permease [Pseudofrankia asymbiotica]|uniref:ABC transporter permease n=1 Tax=Pseudofrankia asymbiotica TaxID=1834516 RepID=A0A1V2HZV0_9ACTN|nr:ABC transporter permease [Pseudofrankia asymbiotica]ONH21992.1 ABC transporter permease [Pseudofrankia asymbiotica]
MADVRLVVGLGCLLAVTVGCLRWARVGRARSAVVAVVRAVVQLTLVSLALRGVFAAPPVAAAALAVMLGAAVITAARRLTAFRRPVLAVAGSCVAGAAVTLGIVFAIPVLEPSTRHLIALSGSVFGGTMTACTLVGRRLADSLVQRRDEIEGWLALGATPRQACAPIARHAVGEALVPALDQTRTTGLVTLPGAFVGALLGGASPGDAARFQIVILAGLLAAETVAAVALAYLLGAPRQLPAGPHETGRPGGS